MVTITGIITTMGTVAIRLATTITILTMAQATVTILTTATDTPDGTTATGNAESFKLSEETFQSRNILSPFFE